MMHDSTIHRNDRSIASASNVISQTDELTADELHDLSEYPRDALWDLVGGSEATANFAFHVDPAGELPRTRVLARRAAQAWNALFIAASYEEGQNLVFEFDDGTVPGISTGLTDYTYLGPWLSAYWWARISHNGSAQEVLAPFTIDILTRGDGHFDPHLVHLATALQARDAGDPSWTQHALAGAEAVTRATDTPQDEALLLHLDLFALLLSIGDHTEFTTQLTQALTNHRTYFTATPEIAEHNRGYISIPILAICSIAIDEGMTLNVTSDYLPRYLLDHPDWMFTTHAGDDSLT